MEIRDKKEGEVVILEPVGRIDTNTASEFESKIVEVMDNGASRFVVDLKEIDYISSAGLRVFLMAIKKLKSMDGSFIICSMSDHIKEVFDISGFTPIFTITADQTSGVAAA
jgi:anti-sigma B factor antagonist